MKKLILALVLSITTMPCFAESKFSGEFLFGTADQDTEIFGFTATSGDDTSIGIRGAYQSNKNIAIELAYQNYGETDDTYIDEFGDTINDKIETTSINLGVKAILPLENGFSLNGRLGLSIWDYKLTETDSSLPGEVFKVDDSGNDFYYGIGAQFDINANIFLSAEFVVLDMGVRLAGVLPLDHEVKNLSLAIGMNF